MCTTRLAVLGCHVWDLESRSPQDSHIAMAEILFAEPEDHAGSMICVDRSGEVQSFCTAAFIGNK